MKRLTALILCLIFVLAGCSGVENKAAIRPAELGVVDFHSEEQQAYLDDSYLFPRGKGVAEWSRPEAIVLSWESDVTGPFTVSLS